jgi:hypothetical protein
MTSIKNSNMWSSIVFHCVSPDARLLCAELSHTDTSACSTAFQSFTPTPTVAPTPAPTNVSVPFTQAPSYEPSSLQSTASPTRPSVKPTSSPSSDSSKYYCGTFSVDESANAKGYFAMKISYGVAYYSFQVNLSSFSYLSSCDVETSGLKFHIHKTWTNTTVSSSAGTTYCGSTYTGGHYDPNYACSPSSEFIDSICPAIGKTTASGYTYSCNTSIYAQGNYDMWYVTFAITSIV